MDLNLYQLGYKAGKDDAEFKYKETLFGIYSELLLQFKGDIASLKKIDCIFERPMEEANK